MIDQIQTQLFLEFLTGRIIFFLLYHIKRHILTIFFFKILFILFFREGKGERKRGRETSMGCLLYTSDAADDWLVV